jgi:DNA-binding NarL/FixJ family response regulator
MDTSKVRVLVVEDFLAFRRFICSALLQNPHLQVVFESSDGQEAVQKAAALQPDLILLDIGLPTLNGLAAARQIRELVPESKIIFVSQESSADVVQEALELGAWGYVLKAMAATDLRAAVQAVIDGQRFVGRGLSVPNRTHADPPGDLPWRAPVERAGEIRAGTAPPENRD